MSWFLNDSGLTDTLVTAVRARSLAAGVDPFDYQRTTAALSSPLEWLDAFGRLSRGYADCAAEHEHRGEAASAASQWRLAASTAHVATTLPHPDHDRVTEFAELAAHGTRRHIELIDGRLDTLGEWDAPYAGELRLPRNRVGMKNSGNLAIIVPGLDSARAEFLGLADALLARGVAVAAIDGPGQGERIDRPPVANYASVTRAALDEILQGNESRFTSITLIGLSLGGVYALLGTGSDPRISALGTISGVTALGRWDELPPFAVDTLTLRCGGVEAAEEFASSLHSMDPAQGVTQPSYLIGGTDDDLPSPGDLTALAERLGSGGGPATVQIIEGGDHLCGNVRPQWLDSFADWVAAVTH